MNRPRLTAADLGLLVLDGDSLSTDAKEAISAAYDAGRHLVNLGAFTKESLRELHHFETFEDLDEKAGRLRCVAEQVHRIASEVMRQAGRLEALAAVRRAAETPGD